MLSKSDVLILKTYRFSVAWKWLLIILKHFRGKRGENNSFHVAPRLLSDGSYVAL
jgi:hypothetical protein